jgi:predicted phosphodiesterase
VRVLLLSDIHGNQEALDACVAAAPDHDVVVNLGDIVGYGASPNEVSQRSRSLGKIWVRGNHDKAAAGVTDLGDFNPIAGMALLWTRARMTPDNMQWLQTLPQGPLQLDELPGVQFVHGSPLDEDEYVVTVQDANAPLVDAFVPVTFFGHTHLQGFFAFDGNVSEGFRPVYATVGKAESVVFGLEEGIRYLINPGSVGQPRDGDWRAAFALFDSEKHNVTFCRTPYKLKDAQDRIIAANLPERLATRLAAGR